MKRGPLWPLLVLGCSSQTPAPETGAGASALSDASVVGYQILDPAGEQVGQAHSQILEEEGKIKVITRLRLERASVSEEYATVLAEDLSPLSFKRLSSREGRYSLDFKGGGFVSVVTDLGAQERQLERADERAVLLPLDDLMLLSLVIQRAGWAPGQAAKLTVRSPRSLELVRWPVQIFANAKRKTVVQLPDGKAILSEDGRIEDYVSERGLRFTRLQDPGQPPALYPLPERKAYERPRAAGWEDRQVKIEVLDGVLSGVLSVPRFRAKWKSGRAPGVLFLSDLGGQNRHGHFPGGDLGTWQLLDRLAEEGFAVLRLDDRGLGESRSRSSDVPAPQAVEDAARCLAFLRLQPEVEPERLFVLGHGFGGVDALMLAGKEKLAGVVTIGAPFRKVEQLLAAQLEAQPKGPSQLEAERQARVLLDALGGAEVAQALAPAGLYARYAPMARRLHSYAKVEVDALIAKVEEPAAIFHGFKDEQASWQDDARAMAESFKRHAKLALLRSDQASVARKEASLFVYEGVDHQMMMPLRTKGAEQRMEQRFVDDLVRWMIELAER